MSLYYKMSEAKIKEVRGVVKADIQEVRGKFEVTAVIDFDSNKSMTLGALAEILEKLDASFSSHPLPNIDVGSTTLCISNIQFKPEVRFLGHEFYSYT
jgi:hypothetical protein